MATLDFRAAARPTTAWKSDDLLRLVSTVGLGLVIMIVAWRQADGKATLEDQIPWANMSVGGALLASYGFVSWILRGRRAIGERRRRLLGEPVVDAATTRLTTTADAGVLVAVEARRFFHTPSCPLTDGRSVETAELATHLAAGRSACGVCRP